MEGGKAEGRQSRGQAKRRQGKAERKREAGGKHKGNWASVSEVG